MKDHSVVLRRPGLRKGLLLSIVTASALALSGAAVAQNAAKTAVEAAKKICAGKTITMLRGQRKVEIEEPILTAPPVKDLGVDKSSAPAEAPKQP